GFDIERSPDGSNWAPLTTTAPDVTAYLDTSLAVGTVYHYRVRASSPVEDSGWSNTASDQTDGIPPVASFTFSETYLDVDFTDTSTDDGDIVSWSWNFGDGNGSSAQNPSHSYAAEGTYTVMLTVTDNHGESDSASQDVTVLEPPPPPFTDHSATGDLPVAGSVSGTYASTATDNGAAQSITERESGGKKNNRHSYLEHRWTFNLPAGTGATLSINAWQSASSDGDNFEFAWSTNGSSWTPLFVSSATSDGAPVSFELGAGVSGTVYLRVTDTDQTQGNRSKDTVYVDYLQVRVSNEPPEPLAGSAPTLTTVNATAWDTIELAWVDNTSNEAGFRVERSTDGVSFSEAGTTGGGVEAFTDTGLSGSILYYYRVVAYKGSDELSSGVLSATTLPPPDMTLSLNGRKVKGKHTVDLSWTGAGTDDVVIFRDGNEVATTTNDGAYTDNIGAKGGATYEYQVCESGGPACSDVQSVSF
ncbi:MAG: PKD domain-containing protein, partial [Gammaproteobacteria bacterium]|nr:PKD domain-containing protein [Gammaproteobacteria bacterium]